MRPLSLRTLVVAFSAAALVSDRAGTDTLERSVGRTGVAGLALIVVLVIITIARATREQES